MSIYWPPFNNPDPDAPYVNGDPVAGIEGSIPPAGAIESPQREILEVIRQAGLDPDPNDFTQLWQALQQLIAGASGLGITYQPFLKIWRAPGTYTYTVPPGVFWLEVEQWGAGGGGGGARSLTQGNGGAGGGYGRDIYAVTPGQVLTITVGAGGQGGNPGGRGADGGVTSVSGLVLSTGGQGGFGSDVDSATPSYGGSTTGATIAITGQDGSSSALVSGIYYGSQGGASFGASISKMSYGGVNTRYASSPGGGGPGVSTQNGVVLSGWPGANGQVIIRGIQP
jgi:hypothetical protein